jgi:lysophospholipid acyltransferase (LPLAT)-like uncharacterized protein
MKLRVDHPAFRRLAPLLVRAVVKVVLGTTRTSLVGDAVGRALLVSPEPVILTSWHCHTLASLHFAAIYCRRKRPFVIMASPSRDGEFIGELGRHLGFIVCPGSRHKGGLEALRRLAAYGRAGHPTGIIADGSRGPARVVQRGVLYLARETGLPILPCAMAYSHKLTLNTWDRFEIPLPLGRSAVLVGTPLKVGPRDRSLQLDARRRELEEALNRLYQESRRLFGRD